MAEPATADGGESPQTEGPDEPGDSNEDDDVDIATTSVEETGADPGGFFDDVETDSGVTEEETIFDGTESGEDEDESPEPAQTKTAGLASDINAGVARAAVIGLDEEWERDDGTVASKDSLQTEFEETFAAFRLGHYAEICAEEYLLADAEDIHPVWGLIGASLICAATIVYKRPDGDQIVDKTKNHLGSTDIQSLKERLTDDGESEEDQE